MPIYNTPNLTGGIDDAVLDVVTEVSVFTPMFLLFVFAVVFIGGSINQKRRTGFTDLPMWATIASLSTLMITLPLSLTSGLIGLETLVIVVVVTLMSGLWLFMDKNKNEV